MPPLEPTRYALHKKRTLTPVAVARVLPERRPLCGGRKAQEPPHVSFGKTAISNRCIYVNQLSSPSRLPLLAPHLHLFHHTQPHWPDRLLRNAGYIRFPDFSNIRARVREVVLLTTGPSADRHTTSISRSPYSDHIREEY